MQLSSNKNILLSVSNDDIINGRFNIPFDVLGIIALFDTCVYQSFRNRIETLDFPRTPEAFSQYQTDIKHVLGLQPSQNSAELQLLCATKLLTLRTSNNPVIARQRSCRGNQHWPELMEWRTRVDLISQSTPTSFFLNQP